VAWLERLEADVLALERYVKRQPSPSEKARTRSRFVAIAAMIARMRAALEAIVGPTAGAR
jgi:hypothetical protein